MGPMRFLRHPLSQTLLVLIAAWALFRFGIAYLPPLIGLRSAPVPSSVQLQYMSIVLVGMLLYMSADATRWHRFKEPITAVMVEPGMKWMRAVLLVLIPVLVGFVTYDRVRPSVAAPPTLRSIHPAPPGQITFRGKTLTLAGLENPLRGRGSLEEHYEEGKRVYYQNCMPCHGDHLNAGGHYAPALNPTPLSFQDLGTIAQLTESFVFWRIAKGGPGLPQEGAPWNSAMPAWENMLTEEEIWSVIIFLYEQTGHTPRTWEEAGHAE